MTLDDGYGALPSDTHYTNPGQTFNGGQYQQAYIITNRLDAEAFAQDIILGKFDPYLTMATSTIRVTQNRYPDGRFAPGFAVVLTLFRPMGSSVGGVAGAA